MSPALTLSAGTSLVVIKIDLFLNLGPDVPDAVDRTEPVLTFDTEDRREFVRPLSNWENDL